MRFSTPQLINVLAGVLQFPVNLQAPSGRADVVPGPSLAQASEHLVGGLRRSCWRRRNFSKLSGNNNYCRNITFPIDRIVSGTFRLESRRRSRWSSVGVCGKGTFRDYRRTSGFDNFIVGISAGEVIMTVAKQRWYKARLFASAPFEQWHSTRHLSPRSTFPQRTLRPLISRLNHTPLRHFY